MKLMPKKKSVPRLFIDSPDNKNPHTPKRSSYGYPTLNFSPIGDPAAIYATLNESFESSSDTVTMNVPESPIFGLEPPIFYSAPRDREESAVNENTDLNDEDGRNKGNNISHNNFRAWPKKRHSSPKTKLVSS